MPAAAGRGTRALAGRGLVTGPAQNLLAQQTLMSQFNRDGPGKGGGSDAEKVWTDGWDGYPAARQRLLDVLQATAAAGGSAHQGQLSVTKLLQKKRRCISRNCNGLTNRVPRGLGCRDGQSGHTGCCCCPRGNRAPVGRLSQWLRHHLGVEQAHSKLSGWAGNFFRTCSKPPNSSSLSLARCPTPASSEPSFTRPSGLRADS